MKIRLILIFAVIAFIFSIVLIRHYLNIPQEKYKSELEKYDKLVKSGVKTYAAYDSVYTEFKRRGNNPIISIKYTYAVKGKQYSGFLQMTKPPENSHIELVYLPENPAVHAISPDSSYENARKNLENELQPPIISWVLLIFSLSSIIYLILSIRTELRMEREFREIMKK